MKKKLLFICIFVFTFTLTLFNSISASAASITITENNLDFYGTTYKAITVKSTGYPLDIESNNYLVDYDGDVYLTFNKGLYLVYLDGSNIPECTVEYETTGTAISTAHHEYTISNLTINNYNISSLESDLENGYYTIIYVDYSSTFSLEMADPRDIEHMTITRLVDIDAVDLTGVTAVKVSSSSTNSFSNSTDETRQYIYEYITELTFQPGIYYFYNGSGAITSFNLSENVLGEVVATNGSYYGANNVNYYNYDEIENLNNDIGLTEGFYYMQQAFKLAFVTNSIDTRDLEVMQLSWDYYELRDGIAPVIDGQNYFIVNVNNMLSMDTILNNIFATDNFDGEVEIVCDETNYDHTVKALGEFTAEVSATDAAGNKTTATITIKVVDTEAPKLAGTTEYTQSYSSKLDLSVLKAGITATDNFDDTLTLNLATDNYSANYKVVGKYTVVYECEDTSGNPASITINVNVIDDQAPVITLPKSIELGTTSIFTLDDFKSKISVFDDYDGEITNYSIEGFENFINNSKTPDSYYIKITASDAAGNHVTVATNIVVRDTTNPEIWLNPYFIAIKKGETLTIDQIKQYAAQALNITEAEILSVDGTWDSNVDGQYSLRLSLADGEEVEMLVVVGDGSKNNTNVFEEIFSADYWKNMANEWATASSWTNVSQYNFLHWTTIVVASLVILAIIIAIIKKH